MQLKALKKCSKRAFSLDYFINSQRQIIVFLCELVADLLSAHSPTRCETSGGLKFLISVNVSVPLSVLASWFSRELLAGASPSHTQSMLG